MSRSGQGRPFKSSERIRVREWRLVCWERYSAGWQPAQSRARGRTGRLAQHRIGRTETAGGPQRRGRLRRASPPGARRGSGATRTRDRAPGRPSTSQARASAGRPAWRSQRARSLGPPRGPDRRPRASGRARAAVSACDGAGRIEHLGRSRPSRTRPGPPIPAVASDVPRHRRRRSSRGPRPSVATGHPGSRHDRAGHRVPRRARPVPADLAATEQAATQQEEVLRLHRPGPEPAIDRLSRLVPPVPRRRPRPQPQRPRVGRLSPSVPYVPPPPPRASPRDDRPARLAGARRCSHPGHPPAATPPTRPRRRRRRSPGGPCTTGIDALPSALPRTSTPRAGPLASDCRSPALTSQETRPRKVRQRILARGVRYGYKASLGLDGSHLTDVAPCSLLISTPSPRLND